MSWVYVRRFCLVKGCKKTDVAPVHQGMSSKENKTGLNLWESLGKDLTGLEMDLFDFHAPFCILRGRRGVQFPPGKD